MKGLASAAIIIAIVVGTTIVVINTITPVIEEGRDTQAFTEAKNALASIDRSIQQLLVESVGARRQVDISLRKGVLVVSGAEDRIKIDLEGFTLLQPGAVVQEGNIILQSGGGIDAVEEDINSDGNTDLVLRNPALTFAIRKLGNSTNQVTVNTTTMITQIYNNRTNTTIIPGSGIFVNDNNGTTIGTGYTALTIQGTNLGSGSILVFVNSTSTGISYEALFTLTAGTDYIELQIKKITGA